jgi:hypothetical protein
MKRGETPILSTEHSSPSRPLPTPWWAWRRQVAVVLLLVYWFLPLLPAKALAEPQPMLSRSPLQVASLNVIPGIPDLARREPTSLGSGQPIALSRPSAAPSLPPPLTRATAKNHRPPLDLSACVARPWLPCIPSIALARQV